jgi:hypothetical protein
MAHQVQVQGMAKYASLPCFVIKSDLAFAVISERLQRPHRLGPLGRGLPFARPLVLTF